MSGFNWVEDLSPGVRAALHANARIRTYGDGTTIYRQGDPVIEVFQIISGEIRQCIFTEDGQEVLIYIYQPGDMVGDSSVSDGDPSSVCFISRGKVELRAWSVKDFNALTAAHPEAAAAVSAQLSRRLRGALRLLEELLTQPIPARIASRFFWILNRPGFPRHFPSTCKRIPLGGRGCGSIRPIGRTYARISVSARAQRPWRTTGSARLASLGVFGQGQTS